MNVTSDGVLRLEWVHFDRAGSALRSVTVRLISSEGVNTDGPNQDEVPLQCNLGAAPDRHGTLQSGGRAEGPTAKPRESRLVLSAMIAWLTGVPRGTGDPSRAMNRSVTRSLAREDERGQTNVRVQCRHHSVGTPLGPNVRVQCWHRRAEGPTVKPRESRLVLSALIDSHTGVPRGTGDPSRAMNRSVTRSLARADERGQTNVRVQCRHPVSAHWTEHACPVLACESCVGTPPV